MAQTKLEVLWEVVQSTIIPFIMGRFMGGHKQPNPATGGGQPDEPLKQQTTSILKPRNDEAIQLAVDAALRKLPDGVQHVANVQAVRAALEPHQQTDWRKNMGSLELTERFEHVMASETITRGGRGNQQQAAGAAAQPGQGGQERIERRFERRPLDYEYTKDDPRVQHLVLVSKIISGEATPELGVAKATAYLLSAGLISKQSPSQKVAAAKDASVRGLYQATLGRPAYDEVQRREQVIKVTEDPDARKLLERELETYIVTESRNAVADTKRTFLTVLVAFLGVLGILFVVGLIIAATLKYTS